MWNQSSDNECVLVTHSGVPLDQAVFFITRLPKSKKRAPGTGISVRCVPLSWTPHLPVIYYIYTYIYIYISTRYITLKGRPAIGEPFKGHALRGRATHLRFYRSGYESKPKRRFDCLCACEKTTFGEGSKQISRI